MSGPTGRCPDSPDDFRRVLGTVPTSVAVIGSSLDGSPVGVSVGSFTSVSLGPPLVGFFVAKSSSTWPLIEPTGGFCASVLAADQDHVCRAFASKGVDRFSTCEWHWTSTGRPVIDGAVAWLDCDIHRIVDAGDHVLVMGLVRAMDVVDDGSPLVFVNGTYAATCIRSDDEVGWG